MTVLRWDIFCQVIDNFGDIGVCWRLAADLAARGQQVRLWVDDTRALRWMAPQGAAGVEVRHWRQPLALSDVSPGDVLVEAFGCEAAPEFVAMFFCQSGAKGLFSSKKPVWINLEYLSAQPYVARMHCLPSPISYGPAAGCTRWFFYPGFTPDTGGLLRERDLPERQAAFDRQHWRSQHGIAPGNTLISLFCYEPPGLPAWWQAMQQMPTAAQTTLAITPGRAAQAMQVVQQSADRVSTRLLAPTCQRGFDEMLWACDLNLVRGEDSLVRALWAGAPLVWHIYPQTDDAHHAKLAAFLDWLDAPASLRRLHALWNGTPDTSACAKKQPAPGWPLPTQKHLQEWRACIQAARARLLAQPDLARQLMAFAHEKG